MCVCTFNGLSISNIFAYDMPNWVKSIVPNILTLTRIVSTQYDSIKHLAPLRQHPERKYIINKNVNSVGISGEYTPMLLARVMNEDIKEICPPIEEDKSALFQVKNDKFINIIQKWMHYLNLGNLSLKK